MTKINLRQSIYITKRISFLLEAGVALPHAFSIIANQMKKRGTLLNIIADNISSGQPITSIISKTKIFGASAIPIIKIGEESGTLAESFSALSNQLEKRAELQQKIIGAILYPACITLGMLVLIIILMTVVFPKMLGVFSSLNVTLPISTRILMWTSDILRHFGLLFLFIFSVLFFTAILYYRKAGTFRLKTDGIIIKIPIFKVIFRAYILASISNVIGLLLTNNSSLITALQVAGQTCSNHAYRDILKHTADRVSAGDSLGKTLSLFPDFFPQEYCDLVSIGEQTGKLAETFTYAHTLYSRDLESLTKTLSSSIEPVLMVFIGLAIGIVAFSVISPMYSITSHLHG